MNFKILYNVKFKIRHNLALFRTALIEQNRTNYIKRYLIRGRCPHKRQADTRR